MDIIGYLKELLISYVVIRTLLLFRLPHTPLLAFLQAFRTIVSVAEHTY